VSPDHDRPRVRALALGAVALTVAAAGAVSGDVRAPALSVVAIVLGAAGAWRWARAGRTGIATSAVVAAVLVALLLLEQAIADVDVVLGVTAAVALAAAVVLRERRLAVSGLLALAALLGRPLAGGASFTHCLVATDLAVPLPRLDGPLLLAVAAVAVGSVLRWTGWGTRTGQQAVARGVEVTGGVGLVVLLAAKATELADHRLLCGSGSGIDPGWVLAGIAVGVVAGLYGLAGHDLVWEAVGLASITVQGLLATLLTGDLMWAAGCAVLLAAALGVAEWLGVAWPTDPGYGVAAPRASDLLARADERRRP
jgi:hypothetical protein